MKKETTAAIVICGKRDEKMLPLFIDQWRKIYPDVELWLGNDRKDPVDESYGLPIVIADWDYNGGSGMINAMLKTNADIVAKLDVDAWHLMGGMFDPFADQSVKATGIQWRERPNRFLGISYAIRREVMLEIELQKSLCGRKGDEDVLICDAIRTLYPNGVHLFYNSLVRRADTYEGNHAMVIHCGIHGRDPEKRELAYAEMMHLKKGYPIHKTDRKVWACMSITPSRLANAKQAIQSILDNRIKPAGIVLSIPYKLHRTGEIYDESLVSELAAMSDIVHVHRCDDCGSITKWLGALDFVTDENDLLLIIDDDNHYSCQMIERMVREYSVFKSSTALANATVEAQSQTIPEAWRGIMVKRGDIDKSKLLKFFAYCITQDQDSAIADDAIIGWFLTSQCVTIKKSVAPVFSVPLDYGLNDDALYKIDTGHMARYNRILKMLNQNRASVTNLINS